MIPTEQRNPNTMHLDREDTRTMLEKIQQENFRSVQAIDAALPEIARAVEAVTAALAQGGRLIYVGAGTSGRIAMADAAECPPTFGVDYDRVIAVIAGGEQALIRASENVEDQGDRGREDLLARGPEQRDVVMGISASGNAAYVVSALETAKERGCTTVSLSSNPDSRIGQVADIPIFVDSGPEVVTGSTRMKAGNVQKMVLNMISTCAMVKTGKVYENLMINLRPTNQKLRQRMIRIVAELCGVGEEQALTLLEENDFVIRKAVEAFRGL